MTKDLVTHHLVMAEEHLEAAEDVLREDQALAAQREGQGLTLLMRLENLRTRTWVLIRSLT